MTAAAELARRAWRVIEPCHQVAYRSPDVAAAYDGLGLTVAEHRYYGGRLAALGPVSLEVAVSVLWGFSPSAVARGVPGVWGVAPAGDIAAARLTGSSRTLAGLGLDLEPAATSLRPVAEAIDLPGRPLAAAHLALGWPDDPAGRLWVAASVLREHRGDAHWQATAEAGLDAVECHVVHGFDGHMPAELLQRVAGWDDEAWAAGVERLRSRGLVDAETVTAAGARCKAQLEHRTDELAARPWRGVTDPDSVLREVGRVAEAARSTGLLETWEVRERRWRDLPRP
ncbi:MAG: hypothetical protein AAFZ07_10485 [Actinomycetota bacterium]